jgi:hypothetical protein
MYSNGIPHMVFVILHTSLAFKLIYCGYKFTIAKLIALIISNFTKSKIVFPCILLYIHHIEKCFKCKLYILMRFILNVM